MNKLLDLINQNLKEYTLSDLAIFKICMILFGVLLGVSFHHKLKKFKFLIYIGVICSTIYIIFKFFKDLIPIKKYLKI